MRKLLGDDGACSTEANNRYTKLLQSGVAGGSESTNLSIECLRMNAFLGPCWKRGDFIANTHRPTLDGFKLRIYCRIVICTTHNQPSVRNSRNSSAYRRD